MNANAELIIDLDQWLLENTREPKAPFRTRSPLHRLNIQNGHFYKEIGSCVTYQGRDLDEGSLVYTLYDQETLTRKVGAVVYMNGERLIIGKEGIIAFNMDMPSKQFVVSCLATESLKLAETGYPIICASADALDIVVPEHIAILDGTELFEDTPVAEMTPQAMRTIINNAFAEVKQANIQEQTELTKIKSQSYPISFDDKTPFPHVTSNGKPKGTIPNLEELLRRLGATVRYNVIKKEDEILIPGTSFCVDNNANACIAEIVSYCNLVGMPTGNIDGSLTNIAAKNQYNPVLTWINSKPWDGLKRWDDFCKTITPKEIKPLPDGTPLHIALIKRWMVSAIAAATSNGISAQGMLVLQGDQNLGKTRWFKSLAPAELDVLQDGVQLRVDDKDSVKQAVSKWMIELGEIDSTFKKSDISALKAFITRDHDELRQAYARKESKFPRRTVFFGSVNPKAFLHDDTGNRRYWVVECENVNFEHGFDMQQVWAEIYEWYSANLHHPDGRPSYTPTADELAALNESNEEFQVIDPIEERILSRLDWQSNKSRWRWTTTTELLIEIGIDKPSRADTIKASACIKKHNGNEPVRRSNGKNLVLAPSVICLTSDNFDRAF